MSAPSNGVRMAVPTVVIEGHYSALSDPLDESVMARNSDLLQPAAPGQPPPLTVIRALKPWRRSC
jgi:hypothetical protein